jgi:hypothetical protein
LCGILFSISFLIADTRLLNLSTEVSGLEIQIMSVFIGVVFVISAYFINVKKKLRFLRGYNQERIRDKKKFIELVSAFYLVSGAILILVPFIFSWVWSIAAVQYVVLANLVLIIYVNVKMVDK